MKKLGQGGQKWLKAFHSVFASLWVGSAIVLAVKQFFISGSTGGELYGIQSTMEFIDDFLIIPGAIGVLLTAIVYSMWTNWGWFKHKWVLVKWVICVYGIFFGTYPLGPWQSELVHIAHEKGLGALTDPVYVHNKYMLYMFGTFQVVTLIFAVVITAIRPWQKKAKIRQHSSAPKLNQ
jgi:hypothetical protein